MAESNSTEIQDEALLDEHFVLSGELPLRAAELHATLMAAEEYPSQEQGMLLLGAGTRLAEALITKAEELERLSGQVRNLAKEVQQ